MTPSGKVSTIEELEALYGEVNPLAVTKVSSVLTPLYRNWIEASRFLILSTVGPEGTDASPRGDDGPVVRIVDDRTLYLPDWRGNNRIDSLRNIVRDDRVSLMFLVSGCENVVRVNGTAEITVAPDVLNSFEKSGRLPQSVVVVRLGEVYFQCAKALMRSGLWSGKTSDVPSAGDFIRERKAEFDGAAYDAGYAEYAKGRMW